MSHNIHYATGVFQDVMPIARSTTICTQICQKNEFSGLEWGGFRGKIGFFET